MYGISGFIIYKPEISWFATHRVNTVYVLFTWKGAKIKQTSTSVFPIEFIMNNIAKIANQVNYDKGNTCGFADFLTTDSILIN